MSTLRELKNKLIIARRMRNESTSNEVFDYWHTELERLINELKGANNA